MLQDLNRARRTQVAISLLLLSVLALQMAALHGPSRVFGATASTPVVGIWSNAYNNWNITDTRLIPNSKFTVQINVTKAPTPTVACPDCGFNGFDLFLYYDPGFISALSVDILTGTLFNNPFLADPRPLAIAGVVRIAVVNLGGTNTAANGTLVNVNFNVTGVGVSPLTLAAATDNPSTFAQSWTRLTLAAAPVEVTTSDGYFKNVAGKSGPVAKFNAPISSLRQGVTIAFNATESYDPDNVGAANKGIAKYEWSYGDQSGNTTTTPFSSHEFASNTGAQFYGNFSVRLTVTDSDDGFQGIKTLRILVGQTPLHDLSVIGVTPDAKRVTPGKPIDIQVELKNLGTFDEVFNLTVQYAAPTVTLGTKTAQPISSGASVIYHFTMNTTGLDGFYTVTAEASILPVVDAVPSNNIGQTIVNVAPASQSPFLYIAVGAAGIIAALVALGILLKRRRPKPEWER